MTIVQKDMFIEDETPFGELPEGWESTPLKTLANFRKGKKPNRLDETSWAGAIPYIDIEAFERGNIRRYADPESSVFVDKGEIIVVWDGARCGHVGKAPQNGALGSTLGIIEPILIHPDYILRFLQLSYDTINTNPRGIGIPHVEPELFWNLELPLAPLTEQKRIATKVEELLARVNTTKDRLAKVSMILKRFRQSVLTAACSGRLTADWRDKMNVLSEEYQKSTMADIGIVSGGITKNSRRESLPMQIPYLRVANVYENLIDLRNVKEIGITPQEFERTVLKKGDILIVEGNGSLDQIGRVAIWEEQVNPCVHQNHLIKFRASELVIPRYALFWLMSPLGRECLMQAAVSTAGLHNLSISKIERLPISVPSISEQHEIVRRVEAMFELADAVEKRVAAATMQAEKLTQAVLAKAFRGELVPTEAELARREGRPYESASELLTRIKSPLESEMTKHSKKK
jgi:type I restriction enzyme S subunit